jgi:hypothetical protein
MRDLFFVRNQIETKTAANTMRTQAMVPLDANCSANFNLIARTDQHKPVIIANEIPRALGDREEKNDTKIKRFEANVRALLNVQCDPTNQDGLKTKP